MTRTSWLTNAGARLDALMAEARHDEAEALALQLLGNEDNHDRAAIALAQCAVARNDLATGLRWAERAFRLSPDDYSRAALYGALLIASGRPREARKPLERALEATPLAMPRVALAQALFLDGDAAAAAAQIGQLLADHPVSSTPLLASLADGLVQAGAWTGWMGTGWMAADGGTRIVGAIRRTPGDRTSTVRVGTPQGTLLALPLDAFLNRFAGSATPSASAPARFIIDMEADAEGLEVSITVGNSPLLGAPARLPRRLEAEGAVDVEGDRLYGWTWLPLAPQTPAELRVTDAAGHSVTLLPDRRVEDAPFLGLDEGRQGFSLDLADTGLTPGWLTVTAGPAGTPLTGSPLLWGDGAIVEAMEETRAAGSRTPTVRPVPVGPRSRRMGRPAASASTAAPVIDIIVPVHAGRAETMACLASVLETMPALPPGIAGEVVVIEDASPEPELVRDLAGLAAQGRITLLSNDRNLGFPATVNRGFRLHPDRDVVLLNADTLVAGDWLARLRAAAYAAPDIGTVTPFSNDATILSYPVPDEEDAAPSPPPSPAETAALHLAAARANAGTVVDLPTAVAFCTYIRRDCLEETGPFEERLFGRGYGEENDFCLRARRFGWRHVGATDVFVAHVGGRSFGRHKRVLMWRNIRVLNRLHPGYDALVGAFLKEDPLAEARRRLDLVRWLDEPAVPSVLLITLDLAGGVARHIAERRGLHARAGRRTLLLSPCRVEEGTPPEFCRLEDPDRRDLRHLVFRTVAEIDLLVAVLRRARVERVEIHHSLNHDPVVLELPARLGVPYDMVIHDYSWICPRITLIGMDGRYCGEPDMARCERCAVQPGPRLQEAISVADLRRRTGRLTAGAQRVIVSSEDVARRLARHVPPSPIQIESWDAAVPAVEPRPSRPPGGRWTVAVIGAIGEHKGRRILLDCARDAALRDLPLEFVLVGYTDDDGPLFATGRVFITGPYREEEAEHLVRAQSAHLAFLPSICPETWCYALSTAWRAGLAVAAFDLGTIAERIRTQGGGRLLDPALPPSALNDALLGILDLSAPGGVALLPVAPSGIATRPRPGTPPVDSGRGSAPPQPTEGMLPMFGSAPASHGAQSGQVQATAQKITFTPGLFSVVVVGGRGVGQPGELPLPSLHLALAPNSPAGSRVSFLGSQADGWLTKAGDALVVKVEGEPAHMLLTSYKNDQQPEGGLGIQIARLDTVPAAAPAVLAPPPMPAAPRTVPFEIMMHVQRQGDLRFTDTNWAGSVGQQLWIEAFSLTPTALLSSEDIEYKALTANGWETPWVAGGKLCGSRGLGTPLVGFAIRLRGAAAERFECLYEGAFVSGQRTATFRNGSPCRSDAIGDPLEGILLHVTEKKSPA